MGEFTGKPKLIEQRGIHYSREFLLRGQKEFHYQVTYIKREKSFKASVFCFSETDFLKLLECWKSNIYWKYEQIKP